MHGSRRRDRGLTLIELSILLAIIAAVVALILPEILGRLDEARRQEARTELAELSSALENYRLDNRIYPTAEQGLQALVEKPDKEPRPRNWKEGGYLDSDRVPTDPWGNPYQYENGPGLGDYTLYSMGADGRDGGSGEAADIRSE